ncbi:uncharacterized protein CLAFUR5_02131 [Fulvia fulva]|uniref:Myb-like domain-containing protein n=1 Tax=Passalora fulva TaxID=5499 RepID=A0A9Q8P2I1_PASFU|nr:uncharacterized protein CLAFUR5_02131 [Fulvia fulva]UJO10963.1 hypothetical protein CLAFUR5_02131 [Fulvia fulva]
MFTTFFGLLRPSISMQLIDSNTGQPLDSKASIAPSITHTDIKKDGNGKMVMVRHKSQAGSIVSGGGDRDAAPKGNKNNNGKQNAKNNDTKAAETDGDGGKPWTAKDDARLKALKAENKTWAQIAEILGRSGKEEVSARFKELNKDEPAGDGGDKKGNAAPAAAEASGGGDFTADVDAKIKEMIDSSTPNKAIAEALGRNLDKALKAHIAQLRNEVKDASGGNTAPAAAEKKQDNTNKGSNGNDFTAADDAKIKELLDAGNNNFKEIAKALGKTMGKDFADHVKELKNQGGGGQDAAAAEKDNEGGKKANKKDKGGGRGGGDAEKKPDQPEKETGKSKEHKHPSKAGSAVSRRSTRSHRSEAKFTMREWMTLQEDEIFSFGELQLLTELINKEPGRSWLSVASAFHDKTGRRVHPEDIREKFDEMARMG